MKDEKHLQLAIKKSDASETVIDTERSSISGSNREQCLVKSPTLLLGKAKELFPL